MKTYPVFLVALEGRRCVVFGGNREAERKARELLAHDAHVTVVAEVISPELRRALAPRGAHHARPYRPGDLRGAYLAISALFDPAVNARIAAEARVTKTILNAMDDPGACDFFAGSVVRRGDLTIAISTGGAAPALAVRLRQRLERTLPRDLGERLEVLGSSRETMRERFPDFEERRKAWYRRVDALLEWEHALAPDPP